MESAGRICDSLLSTIFSEFSRLIIVILLIITTIPEAPFFSAVPWEAVEYYDGRFGTTHGSEPMEFAQRPVGTGAFRFKWDEYNRQARIVLVRNEKDTFSSTPGCTRSSRTRSPDRGSPGAPDRLLGRLLCPISRPGSSDTEETGVAALRRSRFIQQTRAYAAVSSVTRRAGRYNERTVTGPPKVMTSPAPRAGARCSGNSASLCRRCRRRLALLAPFAR